MPLRPSPSALRDRPRKSHWIAVVLWSLVAAAAYGLYSGRLAIPERFNPWAPLDVMAAPDMLTSYKLSRARSDPGHCLTALAQTGMQFDVLPDRTTAPGCGFENAVRLRSAGIRIGAPVSLSCPMALSFFMWEKHALQASAQQHFGQRVAAIDHLGSYACRNVNRGEGDSPDAPSVARSRHATANALDIAGFTLENGQKITVLKNWPHAAASSAPGPQTLMLTDAHNGACQFFNGVLGPDYNAVHRDHFHLETGGYNMCR
ncbi:extensin family protein [Polaromonas sp. DSR2-3-2]|uniref:extensin-like domain-containing protein n=1 Tax=unclassified Polaromonas TaxID=2638319 RepID=UPI003CF518B9